MWKLKLKLNAVILKFGLAVQVLILAVFFFAETADLSCAEKNNINSASETETNYGEAAYLRLNQNQKPHEQNSFVSSMSSKFPGLEKTLDNTDFENTDAMTTSLRYLLVAGGLMGLAGLLIMALRRKKTSSIISAKQFHLCSLSPVLAPLSYQSCNQCDILIKHLNNTNLLSKRSGIWVIEITVSSAFERNKSAAAIKRMGLPVIRLENNFVIIGPYQSKLEAAKIAGDLYEYHNVRGWITPGN